jgi:feruloyl esterase
MGAFNRTAKALAVLPAGFGPAKVATLAAAVRQACDASDGIVDGVVANPAACGFDPLTLRCAAGADTGNHCLSDGQLTVLTAWTAEAGFAGGAYRYPGWGWSGNEDHPDNWGEWVSGNGNVRLAGQYLLQDSTVKAYLAHNLAPRSVSELIQPAGRCRALHARSAAAPGRPRA